MYLNLNAFSTPLWVVGVFLLPCCGFAFEARLSGAMYAPSTTTIQHAQEEVQLETSRDVEKSWGAAVELSAASQLLPFRYGIGFGFHPRVESKGAELAPSAAPIWLEFMFGTRDEDSWFNPFFNGRAGWVAPMSMSSAWWTKPVNPMAQISLGVITRYGLGAEFGYEYSSILKSFSDGVAESRIANGRLFLAISWGIIFGSEHSYRPETRVREIDEDTQMNRD